MTNTMHFKKNIKNTPKHELKIPIAQPKKSLLASMIKMPAVFVCIYDTKVMAVSNTVPQIVLFVWNLNRDRFLIAAYYYITTPCPHTRIEWRTQMTQLSWLFFNEQTSAQKYLLWLSRSHVLQYTAYTWKNVRMANLSIHDVIHKGYGRHKLI